jgi:DNA-binding XRE family transcriptional regulator
MFKSSDRFRKVRETIDLTQNEMGSILGVTSMTIHRWENSEPVLDENKRFLLKKIGINPASILLGEPEDFILEEFTIDQVKTLAKEAAKQEVPQ